MSVLIKGMEMPKDCGKCFVGDRTICSSACPLVPVQPHGDLIDLSAKVNAQYYDDADEEWSIKTVTVEDILYGICEEMPPTIISASEEGE